MSKKIFTDIDLSGNSLENSKVNISDRMMILLISCMLMMVISLLLIIQTPTLD